MAIKKVKRSNLKKQSAHGTKAGDSSQKSGKKKQSAFSNQRSAQAKPKSTSTPIPKSQKRDRSFHFPEVTGKVLEDIEFTADPGYDVITLSFRDNTCMDFVIDTSFTVKADLLDRGQGDHRVLKKWPLMHSSEATGN